MCECDFLPTSNKKQRDSKYCSGGQKGEDTQLNRQKEDRPELH